MPIDDCGEIQVIAKRSPVRDRKQLHQADVQYAGEHERASPDRFADEGIPVISNKTDFDALKLGVPASKDGFIFGGTAVDDRSGVSDVRVYVYDAVKGYTVLNQPAQYDAPTNRWSFPVQASQITPGVNVTLQVSARDTKGHPSSWQFRTVTIEADPAVDIIPPTLAITFPDEAAAVPAQGFTFQGTIFDDRSGIQSVKILILDQNRGRYTVYNQSAAYDAVSGTWSFAVLSSHISSGAKAILWVRGQDSSGNWSSWQYRNVTVQ